MPAGSKVDRVYKALLREGKSKGSAARIAQAQTGKSLKDRSNMQRQGINTKRKFAY